MQYGLIGEHLVHSYSCEIHEKIADYSYVLQELRPDEVGPFLQKEPFQGINVTIPYKETVIPFLDWISPTAQAVGAVNTIVRRDGRLFGYNTDFSGMLSLLARAGISFSGKKVLIAGTGGTAKTSLAVARHLKARNILCLSRTPKNGQLSYADALQQTDAQILINTTPVGMYPHDEGQILPLDPFPALEGVIDAIYHPLRTNLVLQARTRHIPAEGGLYMLAAQAVLASGLFRNQSADEALIEKAYLGVLTEKENTVLIGMPSCGKSTVGKLLSEKTGKPFWDSDDLFTARIGQTPGQYIRSFGEKAFRVLESQIVTELSGKSGVIIATGGGAVLDPANVHALSRNGRLVFLDRSPENLCVTSSRPLSATPEKLAKLYETRRPLYLAAASEVINADASPEAIVLRLLKEESV